MKIGDIPNSVKHLIFGKYFGFCIHIKLINGNIPNSVTHLTFGESFNQIINKGDIPESVTHLTFGNRFKQELNNENLHNNFKMLVLYNYVLDKKIKNTIIILDKIHSNTLEPYYYYIFSNNKFRDNFLNFIENLRGKIIFEELCEKVFNPDRIQRLCNIYGFEFNDYLESI